MHVVQIVQTTEAIALYNTVHANVINTCNQKLLRAVTTQSKLSITGMRPPPQLLCWMRCKLYGTGAGYATVTSGTVCDLKREEKNMRNQRCRSRHPCTHHKTALLPSTRLPQQPLLGGGCHKIIEIVRRRSAHKLLSKTFQ